MTTLHENWRALSIQQPWVDLILTGRKTIEVRYWSALNRRGGFLIHSSGKVDWKTTELLGFHDVLTLPTRRIVGYAQIRDVVVLTNANRLARLNEHWVIHPFSGEPLGAILANVLPFERPVACKGRLNFFSLPPSVQGEVAQQLSNVGVNPLTDPQVFER